MNEQQVIDERARRAGLSDAELERWKRILDQLPSARLEKVRATRSALERNRYDDEEVLNETASRLYAELGVLCREAAAKQNHNAV